MSAKITMKSEQEIKESLLAEIESFNSDLEKARSEFKEKFDKKREVIKAKLDPELKRLKEDFKAFAEYYEEFTGKPVKFSIGSETGVSSVRSSYMLFYLAELIDGGKLKQAEVINRIIAKHPHLAEVRPSLTSQLSTAAKKGEFLKKTEDKMVEVTDAGRSKFKETRA